MKVIHNTPDRFVIVERPWFLASVFFMFTVAVLYALATSGAEMDIPERALLISFAILLPLGARYFIHWVRAEFDRTTGRVDIYRRGFFYDQHRNYSLRYLKRVLVEENNHEGVTRRAVLVFDEAMLSEMDPARRDRLERLKSQGFRQAAAHEAPLTVYYSSVSNVQGAAKALNAWLGVAA